MNVVLFNGNILMYYHNKSKNGSRENLCIAVHLDITLPLVIVNKRVDCVTVPPTPTLFRCGNLPFRRADMTPRSHLSGPTTPDLTITQLFGALHHFQRNEIQTQLGPNTVHRANKTIWRLPTDRGQLPGGQTRARPARSPASLESLLAYKISVHATSRNSVN